MTHEKITTTVVAPLTNISQASEAVEKALAGNAMAALPSDFVWKDLESILPTRRRARGSMETTFVPPFVQYVLTHKEAGACVFVDFPRKEVTAVLNLGTPESPGHADNEAIFKPKATAEYDALSIIGYGSIGQKKAAEFIEDWRDCITCYANGEAINTAHAIAAIRNVTIEALEKMESVVEQLGESRTTFESVKATSKHTLPQFIHFTCRPYDMLQSRTFVLRVGMQTGDKYPSLRLTLVHKEVHEQEMADELAAVVREAFAKTPEGKDLPVYIGTYAPR